MLHCQLAVTYKKLADAKSHPISHVLILGDEKFYETPVPKNCAFENEMRPEESYGFDGDKAQICIKIKLCMMYVSCLYE